MGIQQCFIIASDALVRCQKGRKEEEFHKIKLKTQQKRNRLLRAVFKH
jgi:hypothetical protein